MGLAGLTAVFGMGTGVTPPVWSPEKCPAGGQAEPGTVVSGGWSHRGKTHRCERMSGYCSTTSLSNQPYGITRRSMDGCCSGFEASGAPIGVVKLLGC